jgi:mannose-6-phosphate isomerase-like protein (cupin superfamily)
MNVKKVIKLLRQKYPNKTIIENKNSKRITTEIICEIESTNKHSHYSIAIAVIDSSTIHYHRKITEIYKVMKGNLKVFKYNIKRNFYKEYIIKRNKSITIKPGEIHSNLGKETWVECYSKPGWLIDDYINLEEILKKYILR